METHNIPIGSSSTSSHHDSNTATSSNAPAGSSSPCGSKSSRKNKKKKQRAKRHAIQTAKGELKVKLDKLSALKKEIECDALNIQAMEKELSETADSTNIQPPNDTTVHPNPVQLHYIINGERLV
jgi:hypothetical protein